MDPTFSSTISQSTQNETWDQAPDFVLIFILVHPCCSIACIKHEQRLILVWQ